MRGDVAAQDYFVIWVCQQFEMLYGQTAAALFAKAAELQREARCHSVGGAGCPGLTGE